MKLPLITRLRSDEIFHVLQLEGSIATGVNESTLRLDRALIYDLKVLSEEEYAEYKQNGSVTPPEKKEFECWIPEGFEDGNLYFKDIKFDPSDLPNAGGIAHWVKCKAVITKIRDGQK